MSPDHMVLKARGPGTPGFPYPRQPGKRREQRASISVCSPVKDCPQNPLQQKQLHHPGCQGNIHWFGTHTVAAALVPALALPHLLPICKARGSPHYSDVIESNGEGVTSGWVVRKALFVVTYVVLLLEGRQTHYILNGKGVFWAEEQQIYKGLVGSMWLSMFQDRQVALTGVAQWVWTSSCRLVVS